MKKQPPHKVQRAEMFFLGGKKVLQNSEKGPRSFWRDILSFADKHRISISVLIKVILEAAKRRQKNRKKRRSQRNHLKQAVEALYSLQQQRHQYREALCLTATTGSWENVLFLLSSYFKLPTVNCIIPSSRTLRRVKVNSHSYFSSLLRPAKTYSGYRISLGRAVKVAAFMLWGQTDVNHMSVDIWGDGVEIGKIDMTRLAFRFLGQNISCQSDKSVFTFAIFRGHDSRFVLENSIGWTVVGKQESGWLYQETKQLVEMGVKVSYSGDQPFLLKLGLGITKDDVKEYPSKIPLYVGKNSTHTPLSTDSATKHRTKLSTPFITEIPKRALTYIRDIRCVCPDATHGIIRCVEGDLRKICDCIIAGKPSEAKSLAVERLEKNLTEREVKLPYFKLNIQKNKCLQKSLSGREALTAIADRIELSATGKVQSDLFDGVFGQAELLPGSDSNIDCMRVLRSLQPTLFSRPHPSKPASQGCISMKDAAELWRKSLNNMTILLRKSAENFKDDIALGGSILSNFSSFVSFRRRYNAI